MRNNPIQCGHGPFIQETEGPLSGRHGSLFISSHGDQKFWRRLDSFSVITVTIGNAG